MTERYNRLEVSHAELNAAYEKLRKTVELLTEDDDEGEDGISNAGSRKSSNSDTLRKVLDILHGEIDGARTVKPEST
jgi:AP-1-like factor